MSVGTSGAIQAPPPSAGVLGQGVKYPPEVDTKTGRLRLAWGADLVQQAILSIQQTERDERPMLPGYGAAMVTFEPIDAYRHKLVVEANVAEFEPRAKNVDVDVQLMPTGEVKSLVRFDVVGEATPRTLTATVFTGPSSTSESA